MSREVGIDLNVLSRHHCREITKLAQFASGLTRRLVEVTSRYGCPRRILTLNTNDVFPDALLVGNALIL